MTDKTQEEKEIERKRDEALRRALSAPHRPHQKGGGKNSREPKGKREK